MSVVTEQYIPYDILKAVWLPPENAPLAWNPTAHSVPSTAHAVPAAWLPTADAASVAAFLGIPE